MADLEKSIQAAAARVAAYVEEIATLSVVTNFKEIDLDAAAGQEQAELAASTEVSLTGDSKHTVPMRRGDDGLPEIDNALLAIHQANVQTAIEYRSQMMDALLQLLHSPRRR